MEAAKSMELAVDMEAAKIPPKITPANPAGTYLCCRAKILNRQFDVSFFRRHCEANHLSRPTVLACEYLKSLNDPAHSPYEIQLLLSEEP